METSFSLRDRRMSGDGFGASKQSSRRQNNGVSRRNVRDKAAASLRLAAHSRLPLAAVVAGLVRSQLVPVVVDRTTVLVGDEVVDLPLEAVIRAPYDAERVLQLVPYSTSRRLQKALLPPTKIRELILHFPVRARIIRVERLFVLDICNIELTEDNGTWRGGEAMNKSHFILFRQV